MELKQLEAYVKVFELRNFSKAAEEMFLSQPSVSAYINALEKELQTLLIHRSTKEFLPTESGKLFYAYAKEMLSLRDQSVRSLKSLTDCAAGRIDILASSVPAQVVLPEIVGAFHQLYPHILFNIEQADSADVVKGIASHKGELGFVGAKIENPKCEYEEFLSEKLVWIAPVEKRFEKLSASDMPGLLREEHFVMREPGSGTRFEYEEYLTQAGVRLEELRISAYFNNTQSIIHAVANGLGLSIVSELAVKHYVKQRLIVAIDDDSLPERHFYMVRKKSFAASPAATALMQFVRTYKEKCGV